VSVNFLNQQDNYTTPTNKSKQNLQNNFRNMHHIADIGNMVTLTNLQCATNGTLTHKTHHNITQLAHYPDLIMDIYKMTHIYH